MDRRPQRLIDIEQWSTERLQNAAFSLTMAGFKNGSALLAETDRAGRLFAEVEAMAQHYCPLLDDIEAELLYRARTKLRVVPVVLAEAKPVRRGVPEVPAGTALFGVQNSRGNWWRWLYHDEGTAQALAAKISWNRCTYQDFMDRRVLVSPRTQEKEQSND